MTDQTSSISVQTLQLSDGAALSYAGPDLSEGSLPALFYFSLSGSESLTLDPFNQPAVFIDRSKLRVFSLDIPGHERPLAETDAIRFWAAQFYAGVDIIGNFTQRVSSVITQLIDSDIIDPERIAVAGLSRGAFVAAHCAAMDPRIRILLGFAPLTRPGYQKEFTDMQELPAIQGLALDHLGENLYNRTIRFYIGNRDIRVGTRNSFEVIEAWTEAAFERKIRSPKIELVITPSIGHQGHGSTPDTFRSGAEWVQQQL